MDHKMKSAETQALEDELEAARADLEALADQKDQARLRREALTVRREAAAAKAELELAELLGDDKELGVHYDYLQAGAHIIAFAPHMATYNKFMGRADSAGRVNDSNTYNWVVESLLWVDGADVREMKTAERGKLLAAIRQEFPGLPNKAALVMLELVNGGTSARKGK
jgi:hypothetical protein